MTMNIAKLPTLKEIKAVYEHFESEVDFRRKPTKESLKSLYTKVILGFALFNISRPCSFYKMKLSEFSNGFKRNSSDGKEFLVVRVGGN